MGISAYKRGLFTKALEFVSYAYENETDNMYKSKYVFKLAKIYAKLNNNNKAKEFAEKAANYRKGWGEPYIFIGDLYAKTSRSCGELKTEFLKRVGYWAAIDKYEYAKKIDKSSIEGAEERIKKYSEQMPSKTDVFTEGLLDVPTYQIDCWYSEKVSIRVPN
jgi:tetratricopeptide (TPR) repeat protein